MHHIDPQWTPGVIQEDAADAMYFSRINQLSSWDAVAGVEMLDTTHLTLHEVARRISDWIRSFDIAPHEEVLG